MEQVHECLPSGDEQQAAAVLPGGVLRGARARGERGEVRAQQPAVQGAGPDHLQGRAHHRRVRHGQQLVHPQVPRERQVVRELFVQAGGVRCAGAHPPRQAQGHQQAVRLRRGGHLQVQPRVLHGRPAQRGVRLRLRGRGQEHVRGVRDPRDLKDFLEALRQRRVLRGGHARGVPAHRLLPAAEPLRAQRELHEHPQRGRQP
mmetsp:Transcript_8337/g.20578  ORF Transcript_8337/g.20578 Transcript_8337/m.20578 type:complete len:202 (-) Transcript_8337:3869-4474(-)